MSPPYLGQRIQSGLHLLPSGQLESHARSRLGETVLRQVAGVEVEVTASYIRRGERALSLPAGEKPWPAWAGAGPSWGRRLLMRRQGLEWHAAGVEELLS